MKLLLTAFASLIFLAKINAQAIGIGTATPSASAQLEISATDKGLLIPRINLVSLVDIATINNPAVGLLIYNTNNNAAEFPDGTGFYYWNGEKWIKLITTGAIAGSAWLINGNSGTDPQNHFLGTTDNKPFKFRTNNLPSGIIDPINSNTSLGLHALGNIQGGFSNVAIGTKALFNNLTGDHHVAIGDSALHNQNEGFGFNVAIGSKAMFGSVGGSYNTAVGAEALFSMPNSIQNVAIGVRALYQNLIGFANTAVGTNALYNNISGTYNVADGFQALYSNMSGQNNTSIGGESMYFNVDGGQNTAIGRYSLRNNTSGESHTAVGFSTLSSNVSGFGNTAVGFGANVSAGNLNFASAFGANAFVNASEKVVIGSSSVTVIGGAVNWSIVSDGRFKTDINENVPGLNFIMKLRPVTYRLQLMNYDKFLGKSDSAMKNEMQSYKKAEPIIRSGFIAQEVEIAANESGYSFGGLHKPESEKDNYSLSYSDFVVPIIKAMQEQQMLIGKLQKQNEELLKRLEALEKRTQ